MMMRLVNSRSALRRELTETSLILRLYYRGALSAVFAAVFVGEAYAERPHTGEDLLRLCEKPASQFDRDYCYGLARGAEVGIQARDSAEQTCTMAIPADATHADLLEAVIASLKAHPELRQQPASDVVIAALTNRWPCS
jgi:hypothetical protein